MPALRRNTGQIQRPRADAARSDARHSDRGSRVTYLSSVAFDAFYESAGGDTFISMAACAGPWDAASQHGGPVSALVARAFERHEPVEGQQLSRVTVDILRPVPVAPLTLRVQTDRPGRRVTLLEGVVEAAGQEAANLAEVHLFQRRVHVGCRSGRLVPHRRRGRGHREPSAWRLTVDRLTAKW